MIKRIKARVLALDKPKRVVLAVLCVALVLTVAFVFSNSAKKPAASMQDSDAVKDFISEFIPPESDLGQKILGNIRKIAHFTEYGLMGLEVSAILLLLFEKRKERYASAAWSVLFALVIAFLDETVQMFSKRGPAIADVWIDVGGFFTYSLLFHLAVQGVRLITLAVRKITALLRKENNG